MKSQEEFNKEDFEFYTYMTEDLFDLLKKSNRDTINKVKNTVLSNYVLFDDMKQQLPSDDSVSFAYAQHGILDKLNNKMLDEASKHDIKPTCKKGCGFCCFQKVDVTKEESILINTYIKEKNIKINQDVLNKQSKVKNPEDYMKLDTSYRKCVFLDKNMSCGIYEHRPASCRNHIVVSESDLCDTDKHLGGKIKKINSFLPEIMLVSMHQYSKDCGGLAEMLLKHPYQSSALEK